MRDTQSSLHNLTTGIVTHECSVEEGDDYEFAGEAEIEGPSWHSVVEKEIEELGDPGLLVSLYGSERVGRMVGRWLDAEAVHT